ncbi:hypothetical protein MTQ00_00130 [Chryseobacterium sp. B21-037]|uniref:hypothetical protein n=1 Tax=Chryseobacterium sp. B21-037 TaxID=2926038 RepID=UPI00235818EA|nr:hypothetical protein [Chryseobacterium sp. B21-037]MDC8102934.1 hypothetical protein [Chryseobacterium sp. B21-037]
MEQIIIIGLLIVIILLLIEKTSKKQNDFEQIIKKNKRSEILIGEIKDDQRLSLPIDSLKSQNQHLNESTGIFDSETKVDEVAISAVSKNLEELFAGSFDLVDEEEEWRYERDLKIESGFASGVTFQELSTVGRLLQDEVPEPALDEEAVNIIRKIEGTELFNLLENSLEGASLKVARLLQRSNSENQSVDTSRHNDDVKGFDIGEFV